MYEEISATAASGQLAPGTWAVNDTVSHVRFEVGNLWGLAKVRGEFKRVRGRLAVGPDSVDGQLTLDASSLNTGNKRRDEHLRSADFFGVEHHPEIRFETSSVTSESGGLIVTGDLLIGDARLPLSLPVEVYGATDDLVLSAKALIAREHVGLGWNRLGMIGGDALVNVELTLIREP